MTEWKVFILFYIWHRYWSAVTFSGWARVNSSAWGLKDWALLLLTGSGLQSKTLNRALYKSLFVWPLNSTYWLTKVHTSIYHNSDDCAELKQSYKFSCSDIVAWSSLQILSTGVRFKWWLKDWDNLPYMGTKIRSFSAMSLIYKTRWEAQHMGDYLRVKLLLFSILGVSWGFSTFIKPLSRCLNFPIHQQGATEDFISQMTFESLSITQDELEETDGEKDI